MQFQVCGKVTSGFRLRNPRSQCHAQPALKIVFSSESTMCIGLIKNQVVTDKLFKHLYKWNEDSSLE